MKDLIKKIKEKADSIEITKASERRIKGVYVDCLCMLEEEQERINNEKSLFTILVDYDNHRIGINKAARLIDELYKTEE